jgi:hypothetical protein
MRWPCGSCWARTSSPRCRREFGVPPGSIDCGHAARNAPPSKTPQACPASTASAPPRCRSGWRLVGARYRVALLGGTRQSEHLPPRRATLGVVDEDFRKRAQARRSTMVGGVARSFEQFDAAGQAFWASAPPGAKLAAVRDMLTAAWLMGGRRGPAPRFDGSTWGVLKHGG